VDTDGMTCEENLALLEEVEDGRRFRRLQDDDDSILIEEEEEPEEEEEVVEEEEEEEVVEEEETVIPTFTRYFSFFVVPDLGILDDQT